MIEIDGSYKEGGGQILRTASLLSCATSKGIHIFNIRKGRTKPGVKYQHLFGFKALVELYNASLKGADLGSTEVWFEPSKIVGGQIFDPLQIKIPTAGSITLVLQSLIIPCSLFNLPIKIIFDGGATDTSFAPSINYYLYVLLPILYKMGYKVEVNIISRGYYPKGGAKLETTVYPNANPSGVNLTQRGKLQKISIISYASKFLENRRVAERQAESALKKLQIKDYKLEIRYFDTVCPGSSLDIIAEYENTVLGANALGEHGKRAETVGEEAAQILLENINSGGCLDRYMADQILPYVALASDRSEFSVSSITDHCLTNMWVIEKFVQGKFQIKGNVIRWQRE